MDVRTEPGELLLRADDFEALGIGLLRHDLARGMVRLSRKARELLLLDAAVDELSPEALFATVSLADLRVELIERYRAYVATSPPIFELSFPVGQGEALRWLSVSMSAARSTGEGEIRGTVRDVTEQQRALDRHRAVEEQFRLFAELANDYVYVVDWTKLPLQPEIVSGSFERVTGYSLAELAVKGGWLEIVHPEDIPRMGALAERLASGEKLVHEYRIITKEGAVRSLRDRITPVVNAAGERVRLIGCVTDVTEQVALAEQLAHAQRLEAVARLAGGVAHDLNNLLAVATTGLDAIRRGTGPVADARRSVEQAVASAAELVRSLLAFGRRQTVVPRAVRLADIIRDTLPMVERIGLRDVQVSFVQRANPIARVDPGQLQLALLNLAANARDAMPDGGVLTFEVDRTPTTRAGETGAASARLIVRDTGIGMTADVLQHLFEPYFTTKPRGEGTGLGLSSVHGIVEQLGGEIVVDSTPGEGTTFILLLPEVASAEPEGDPPLAMSHGGPRTVLVVEDLASLRTLLTQGLQAYGDVVHAFASYAEAAAISDELLLAADLVISDLHLGTHSGRDLVAALLRRRPALPALLMSGAVGAVGGPDGADIPVIAKPFKLDELRAAMESAMQAALARG